MHTKITCKQIPQCLFRILEGACVQFASQSFVLVPLGLNHKVQPAKLAFPKDTAGTDTAPWL